MDQARTRFNILACNLLIMACVFVQGCSTRGVPIPTRMDGEVLDVQSMLYVYGARKGRPKPWMVATPEWYAKQRADVIDEYKGKNSIAARSAKYSPWKIYGELNTGDRLQMHGVQWVDAGSAFAGPISRGTIMTGPYAGATVDLEGLVINKDTGKGIDDYDPREGMKVGSWILNSRYVTRHVTVEAGDADIANGAVE